MSKEFLNIVYDKSYPDDCVLDVYLPDTEEPCSVLIFFHGGGIEGGSRKTYELPVVKTLTQNGIAVISADYRIYPKAKFPDFLEDAAKAFSWAVNYHSGDFHFNKFYIGGSSAGSYISMMLYFDSKYLGRYNISPNLISGCIFDAGQPTVHYNVLRERGEDTRAVRVDEAAPLYFVNKTIESSKSKPIFLFLVADNDMEGRLEQTQMFMKTMQIFGYDMSCVTFKLMIGYSHCAYVESKDENGEYIYYQLIRDLILNKKDL